MKPRQIIYADDDPDIRDIVEVSLGLDPSLVIHGCASGQEVLDASFRCRPDLILLDVLMPIMDGPTTLARLRENAEMSEILVIFMTASVQHRMVNHYMMIGANGVICKPFDPMKLAASVREYLAVSRAPLVGPSPSSILAPLQLHHGKNRTQARSG